jgi:hypothetical protein
MSSGRRCSASDFRAGRSSSPPADRPTIFLGSRGWASMDVSIDARKSGHHSGNWGGLASSDAIQLVHELPTLVDAKGRILVPELRQ